MAKVKTTADVDLQITFTINEVEARALEALVGYSDEAFLKTFYEKMGRHYLQPHERGLLSFFATVRASLHGPLQRVDDAREVYAGRKRALNPAEISRLSGVL
jgi:hypothetical protein